MRGNHITASHPCGIALALSIRCPPNDRRLSKPRLPTINSRDSPMRFDSILDSIYILGSLGGPLTGSPVCPSMPHLTPSVVHDITPPTVTAFINVNVVPMDSERVLVNQTVVVEGNRIVELGPAMTVQVPA